MSGAVVTCRRKKFKSCTTCIVPSVMLSTSAIFASCASIAFRTGHRSSQVQGRRDNLIIMIDGQGDLATADANARKEAVENHFKWVDAAAAMGCHSIRVNLSGTQEPEAWVEASVDGLTQLSTYAKDKNINIIVENHGGLSSKGELLATVMTKVNMDNCGTLPDFGNFCIEWGEWPECNEWYDRYKGMSELMPFAKAVSAKSHDFDEKGEETHSDYTKMLQIVKDAGYSGFIGVEYEGSELSEEEGIIATRDLLLNTAKTL